MAVIFGRVIGRERDCRGEGVSRQVCVLYQRVGFTYLELLISGQDHLLLAHLRQSAPGSCHRYSTAAPRFPRSVLIVSAATDVDQIEAVPNRMMRRSPPPVLVVQGSSHCSRCPLWWPPLVQIRQILQNRRHRRRPQKHLFVSQSRQGRQTGWRWAMAEGRSGDPGMTRKLCLM